MAKRKKPPVKRVRRSPYQRSLEYATKRLTIAIAERETYAQKLFDLDKEIPYLQTVIRALTPDEVLDVRKPRIEHANITAATFTATADQSEFLKRFVKPIEVPKMRGTAPTAIIVDELEDGKFIPDLIPGKELLP